MATTQLADAIVPGIWDQYTSLRTAELSALIRSGAMQVSEAAATKLRGGSNVFTLPAWNDLADVPENIATDAEDDRYTGGAANSTPQKTTAISEIAVRQVRNQSWSAAQLTAELAGSDPMSDIAEKVASYKARRLQDNFIAIMNGVFADNAAAPAGTEHVQNDLTHDISGNAAGAREFSAPAVIDTLATMGDNKSRLSIIFMHSIVMATAQKNNMIQYIPDARGEHMIPTYLGREVVEDDSMPQPAPGAFETWFFGIGAAQYAEIPGDNDGEVARRPDSGNGNGSDVLYSRCSRVVHITGHAWAGTLLADGGPNNSATANNFAHADSFVRVYPERKQLAIARMISKEF